MPPVRVRVNGNTPCSEGRDADSVDAFEVPQAATARKAAAVQPMTRMRGRMSSSSIHRTKLARQKSDEPCPRSVPSVDDFMGLVPGVTNQTN
jgi:hypothetical protein